MKIFLWAHFGKIGGGQSKSAALVRLWRRRGIEVSILHWGPMDRAGLDLLAALGCSVTCLGHERELAHVPEIRGGLVIGICNHWFVRFSPLLRQLNCRLVWDNCMTSIGADEGILYETEPPFDAYIFESAYQQATLLDEFARLQVQPPRTFLIREALEFSEFEFSPQACRRGGNFVVGQLARPDIAKWSRRLWDIYGLIDHPQREAVVMGVNDKILGWLRKPPDWATILPPGAMPAQKFYERLHCLVPINFSAIENWPRVGLEAMACGVPIVALKQGGWCDMIDHGQTGLLAADWREYAAMASALGRDEDYRMRIIFAARDRLHSELANPDLLWASWEQLFAQLA